jgi:hypothetical protein
LSSLPLFVVFEYSRRDGCCVRTESKDHAHSMGGLHVWWGLVFLGSNATLYDDGLGGSTASCDKAGLVGSVTIRDSRYPAANGSITGGLAHQFRR